MPKVLLVEDDNNLREIFEMRLQAEGYKTVTAGDGEEALDIAVKEKPDLIIADIMMPRLSGFEMLETLRASPEIANAKVIMMTALGQAEDRARGEKLGVVKYLVKSQVTLEDFVRVVREVLPPSPDATETKPTNNQGGERSMQDDNSTSSSPAPADNSGMGNNPISGGNSGDASAGSGAMSTEEEKQNMNEQVDSAMGGGSTGGDMGGSSGGAAGGGSTGDSGTSTTGGSMPAGSPPMDDDKGEGENKDMPNPTGAPGGSGGSM